MARKKTKSRNALRELTRRHIQESVVRAVTRVGVHGLTMDRVAEEARIAKGTIYLHFRTKEDLVRQTFYACLAPMIDELVAILDSDLPPDERLRRFTRRHLSYFEDHRDLFRVLLHERSRSQIRTDRRRSSLYKKLVEKTASVIEVGVQSRVFRDVDPVKLAGMMVDANITVISHRLLEERPDASDADAAFLSGVFMEGIHRSPTHEKRGASR
jgi:TetR/AcrR family transcriptional regulator